MSAPEQEVKLLPCPFCGLDKSVIWEGEQTDREGHRSPEFSVQCYDGAGGCQAEIHGDTKAEAVAAWNTRQSDAARTPSAREKALEEENERLFEVVAMSIAEMSRARGRLEAIAGCNEDRRIAAALGTTCDFARTALAARQEPRDAE